MNISEIHFRPLKSLRWPNDNCFGVRQSYTFWHFQFLLWNGRTNAGIKHLWMKGHENSTWCLRGVAKTNKINTIFKNILLSLISNSQIISIIIISMRPYTETEKFITLGFRVHAPGWAKLVMNLIFKIFASGHQGGKIFARLW